MVNLQVTVPLSPAWNKKGEGDRVNPNRNAPLQAGHHGCGFVCLFVFFRGGHRKTESDKFKAKFQDIAYLSSHEVGCLPPPTGGFELCHIPVQ